MNKTNNIFKFSFNWNHFMKVLYAKGILVHRYNEIKNHPLLGKKCICTDETNIDYYVYKVNKHWHLGYYEDLVLHDQYNSSRCMAYKNISCHNKTILDEIDINQKIIVWNKY